MQKQPRIEKSILIPLREFLSYRYVRESRYWGATIHDARKKRGFMAILCGYLAKKQPRGWNIKTWWLKPYDAPIDDTSCYGTRGNPCEAVNPQDVVLQYFPERLDEPMITGGC